MFCSNCGKEILENMKFCPFCGGKVEIIKDNKCPSCGDIYEEDDIFCANCGFKLKKEILNSNKEYTTMQEPKNNYNTNYTKNSASANYNNKINCPFCGSSVQRYTKKCPNCGEWLSGVSHFGCGSFLVLLATIIAIFIAIGGESIGIPFLGEIGGIWLIIIAFLFFLPSLIADWRGHDSKFAIFLVNLLLGWFFGLGWIIALILAFTGRRR